MKVVKGKESFVMPSNSIMDKYDEDHPESCKEFRHCGSRASFRSFPTQHFQPAPSLAKAKQEKPHFVGHYMRALW
ncbi:hypothetical protein GUITHDRAFT_107288 [Guillardia theta CCMP2712]|uniref:Uncharacterized protein n=1 Tax=Guillardia theta (strain CCMP2712) TaxID=905079 RepID=L1JF59_GUITC|nr:hypothetical protein GUITHDRAFT_107288 [Guillardia theta CCMP2712]EKX46937.1 hypothetical protein GUITHDRAFT_107288 [Guillardia theta CCMP2712]|eukprot:XP_005833917.1 hypothetical protein GUITHDRAFT_107288 [Guillardia theta CCMP2712]